MIANANKIIIIGTIGANLKIDNSGFGGDLLAEFEVATSTMEWDGDDERERTDYHLVTAEGQLAGVIKDVMGVGALVYIEGEVRTERMERDDKPGFFDYLATVSADTVRLLSRPADEAEQKLEAVAQIARQALETASKPAAAAAPSRLVRPNRGQPQAAAPAVAPAPTPISAPAEPEPAAPAPAPAAQSTSTSQPTAAGIKPWMRRGAAIKTAA